MADWVITIPKSIKWDDYRRELTAVENDPEAVMNFRVPHRPLQMQPGDRMFVAHDGFVRGWMTISDIVVRSAGFRCTTTDAWWPAGVYVQRKGRFTYVDPIPMRGFQGYRRFQAP